MGFVLRPPTEILKSDLGIDVEIHHLEMRTPLAFSSVRVIADGPLRASIEGQVKYGKSTITVTVCLFFGDRPRPC